MADTTNSLSPPPLHTNLRRPTPIPSPQIPPPDTTPPMEISVEQILVDLRRLALETPANNQPTLVFHLFNFIHQQEEPNTSPLHHLINYIATLLLHATPLHQAHLTIGLYVLIQMVQTNEFRNLVNIPNGFRFIHRRPPPIQPNGTSNSRDSTPPPPLEPFSPAYSLNSSTESIPESTATTLIDNYDSDKENAPPSRHAIQLRHPLSHLRTPSL